MRPGIAAAVAGLLVLAGCSAPDGEKYAAGALLTVESAASEVATALLVLEQRDGGRLTGPYADQVVTAAETALGTTAQAFGSAQPPSPADDPLEQQVTGVLGDAQDAVTAARIAVRRDDGAAMHDAHAGLEDVADRLEALEGELR